MDINDVPKKLCENISVVYSPEYFVMVMFAGSESGVYALTPGHAKRLSQYLAHRVAEYEKEHGEISAEWPNIESPIQASELRGTSDGSSEDNEGDAGGADKGGEHR